MSRNKASGAQPDETQDAAEQTEKTEEPTAEGAGAQPDPAPPDGAASAEGAGASGDIVISVPTAADAGDATGAGTPGEPVEPDGTTGREGEGGKGEKPAAKPAKAAKSAKASDDEGEANAKAGEKPAEKPAKAGAKTAEKPTAKPAKANGEASTRPAAAHRGRIGAAIARIPYNTTTWIVAVLVSIFGGLLRFIRLGVPHALVFDETYYVKDAWSQLKTGEARSWSDNVDGVPVNDLFAQGQTDIWNTDPAYIVHPPMGKWFIAIGLKLFGGASSSFAWRFSSALAGTIAILLICRVALHLFHNLTLSALAGVLMSVDGLGITMSRIGILDVFIMVLTLGALLCLINHRDWALRRLEAAHERDLAAKVPVLRRVPLKPRERRGDGGDNHPESGPAERVVLDSSGPVVAFSWWRVGAVVLLGLATGVKWSGAYFMAVFSVISVLWDGYNRRKVGYRNWFGALVYKDGLIAAAYMVPLYIVMYFVDWINWFIHPDSYLHNWAAEHPGEGVTWLPEGLRSFVEYHRQMMEFHTGLSTPHAYKANPFTWPIQWRPTSFYWNKPDGHPGMCSTNPDEQCVQAITSLGNPILWWAACLCAVAMVAIVIARRGDWRAWAIGAGLLGGWCPWWLYLDRTTFTFYAIVILPSVILIVCYVLDWLRLHAKRSVYRWVTVSLTTVILIISIYFYPIWTSMSVPYAFWLQHMWLPTWI